MPNISLNPRERICLENLIAQQQGKAGDLLVFFRVLKKLRTTAEYRSQFVKQISPTAMLWDIDAVDQEVSAFKVELERAEVDKISEVLRSYQSFSVSELEWVYPLQEKIAEIRRDAK